MAAPATPEQARDHLRAIASEPRPAGSAAEERARAYCRATLLAAGFTVDELSFEYSAAPGRWGTPAAGVVAGLSLLYAAALGASGAPGSAAVVLVAVLGLLAGGGLWLGRRGVLALPTARRTGINLVARRGEPRVWLVAHLDSKSQPVPILVRAASIAAAGLLWLAALAAAGVQGAGVAPDEWTRIWWWIAGAGAVASVPIVLSVVGARSPGALDNASGVAAVLLAAASSRGAVGVLLTSAEELGLAGARAWVARRAPATALNCDGVDDAGAVTAMFSGRRPPALLAAVERAASRVGGAVRARRLVPGILTDGVALADAGWSVVTLSKGGIATLARIHTARDGVARMTGGGVAEVARLMTATLEELE